MDPRVREGTSFGAHQSRRSRSGPTPTGSPDRGPGKHRVRLVGLGFCLDSYPKFGMDES